MKRLCTAAALLLVAAASTWAITGREVAENVEDRSTGDTTHALVQMRLVDAGGEAKNREIEQYGREENDLMRNVIVFHRPASVEGTRFLTIERADGDDDQWIYLPGLDRVRRIAGGEGDDAFMGTDFTYNDLEGRDIDEYEYELLREESVGEWETYVVETVPKPETDSQYSRLVQYVDKNSWVPVKIEFYDDDDELLKVNRVHRMERVQGYWTIIENTMENVQTDHRTELQVTNFRYNEELPDGLFTVNFLETGRP
ncbi:MAG: outer membrane lipoprotein-sorting protein [Spirochaetaceae bacterium]